MPTTTTIEPDNRALKSTSAIPARAGADSAIAARAGADSVDSERPSRRRKLAMSLVALIAGVAAFAGIVFPGMLAAAIAVGLVAIIVVLDLLLSPREPQQAPLGYWTF
jgi:anti-sigma factor RsiW